MAIKKAKAKKDIWFVLNAVALACIVMAVLITIEPVLEPVDPDKPKPMAYAATTQLVRAQEVPGLLVSDKPTLLVIYASWCPTCRSRMPLLVDLLRDGTFKDMNVVFLSKDHEIMELSRYLLQTGFYKDVKPVLHNRRKGDPSLVAVLRQKGSQFQGGIPFTEVYSPDGRATTFIPHYASKDAVRKALQKQ